MMTSLGIPWNQYTVQSPVLITSWPDDIGASLAASTDFSSSFCFREYQGRTLGKNQLYYRDS